MDPARENLFAGVRGMLQAVLPVLWPILAFSAVFNVLLLSGSFFMLLVYDDVLASRSGATLAGLLLMVTVAYIFQGAIDVIRSRVMLHTGAQADRRLCDRLYDVISRYEQEVGPLPSGAAPVRDLDLVRGYITGAGPLALLDLPYVLMFLLILTLFHWVLGLATLAGVLVMIVLMVLGDRQTRGPALQAAAVTAARFTMAEDVRRNGEVLRVLGMGGRRRSSWDAVSLSLIASHDELAGAAGRMQVIGKAFRLFLQSFVLAVGAFLVIDGDATGGVIIAGSILSARALMPVEQTIGQWKPMTEASQAWRRLTGLLEHIPIREAPMPLPRPRASLEVQGVVCGPPGRQKVTVANVSFRLSAGEALAVIGHSGSGKSTLMRAVTGAWPLLRGAVRLDGASLEQWDPVLLGRDIGYVPQAIELFDGTLAQNIARFDAEADPEAIIAAARAADVHDMIVALPGGYEYVLGGSGGGGLSAGQKQRIALARALYGDPFLIVLDEPNSNLDAAGEDALVEAVRAAKQRGAIVVIVGHRPTVFAHVDHIMIMADGQLMQMGERTEMLKRINFNPAPQSPSTQSAE
ncbi:type I secretion system permease/ATPase [Novosphingobium sp. P6W]|uniref:type I secretion system permease/ATPase n=1 Tax=Novosphingobium sp. P6W TaxID=1609758 RepID=UPI0005C2D0B9|nr:type I secretion system permease/ATPase [Novosphingobium sp. P6W]AXB77304.1 type I secretion system permease/ATPase [Novosphingobium sp. P6W]KIS33691.1 type I secretion protein [Novosphingobium sp. P6W]